MNNITSTHSQQLCIKGGGAADRFLNVVNFFHASSLFHIRQQDVGKGNLPWVCFGTRFLFPSVLTLPLESCCLSILRTKPLWTGEPPTSEYLCK